MGVPVLGGGGYPFWFFWTSGPYVGLVEHFRLPTLSNLKDMFQTVWLRVNTIDRRLRAIITTWAKCVLRGGVFWL